MKEHLWVLWTDYFKPEHLEKHPDLHDKFWKATKEAGAAKKSNDPAQGQQLLDADRRDREGLLGDEELASIATRRGGRPGLGSGGTPAAASRCEEAVGW